MRRVLPSPSWPEALASESVGVLGGGAAAGKERGARDGKRREAGELQKRTARKVSHVGSFRFGVRPLPCHATGGDPFPSPLQPNARKLRAPRKSIHRPEPPPSEGPVEKQPCNWVFTVWLRREAQLGCRGVPRRFYTEDRMEGVLFRGPLGQTLGRRYAGPRGRRSPATPSGTAPGG